MFGYNALAEQETANTSQEMKWNLKNEMQSVQTLTLNKQWPAARPCWTLHLVMTGYTR